MFEVLHYDENLIMFEGLHAGGKFLSHCFGVCTKNMRCDVAFGYQFIVCSEADENQGKR